MKLVTRARSAILPLCVAAVSTALIWALSRQLSGSAEPWDADNSFYPVALIVTGVLVGGILQKPLWALYIGAVGGQLLYMLVFLTSGPLLVLGIAFLFAYALLYLAGAIVGAVIRRSVKRG